MNQITDAIASAEALSLDHLIVASDALRAAALGAGLERPSLAAIDAMRIASDFLYQAAFAVIVSPALDDNEVLDPYRFALAKFVEVAAMLPVEAQTVPAKWFGTLAHVVEPTPITSASSYINDGRGA